MKNSKKEIEKSQVNHIYGLIKSAQDAGIKVIIKCPTKIN